MAELFAADGVVEIFFNRNAVPEKLTELAGAEAIGAAGTGMMKPHPELGRSHHTTQDHIIEIDGDEASLDA